MKTDMLDNTVKPPKKTPRKTSVDSSYRNKFCEKLRSNSSFKKKVIRDEDLSTSPKAFRDRSASRPGKSVGRLDRANSKNDFDFIPLTRKNTKHSDALRSSKGNRTDDQESDQDFYSQMTKSYVMKTGAGFESKDTLSNCKSSVTAAHEGCRLFPQSQKGQTRHQGFLR
jgi:hypothetical protein